MGGWNKWRGLENSRRFCKLGAGQIGKCNKLGVRIIAIIHISAPLV